MGDRKQARDEEFQSFVIGRWPRLMRTAFLLAGEQHAAEDLVQSTLEQVYVAWRRVGAADDPEAYVRRVMINGHARKHRRKLKEFLAPKDDSGLTHELPDSGDRIAQADDRSALLKALAQLPARQREAVVLRYWEDLSESQVAEAMGCSVGAVKSNAAKGIAKLRAIPGLAEMVTHGGRK
ncbi:MULTISPECIES: SigE family RNA polymerase sigma factor [Streptomyces]|jgi:RNA polymerase sigma-70 factor (sigma-E family)|uniref:SigE family RNA polymerase sigma factor n=2 Tax=Streptomyces TaxID=1883 RepID=A0AB39S1M4_9ACTN|nr:MULTISPECIES: SigE family RNA polymerase sigma factor [unclassified Streptomyces]WSP70690.1 SigE family RNA polymerase sigma factor [Streptomyces sp. NBC_01236]WTI39608.1 SigE family RNA polymerase sigma factor [Streptomyces sp. NBC_00775]WUB26713.1 SigE family RNA polymerase sigma factor [Streptomyces sp. NBC_00589]